VVAGNEVAKSKVGQPPSHKTMRLMGAPAPRRFRATARDDHQGLRNKGRTPNISFRPNACDDADMRLLILKCDGNATATTPKEHPLELKSVRWFVGQRSSQIPDASVRNRTAPHARLGAIVGEVLSVQSRSRLFTRLQLRYTVTVPGSKGVPDFSRHRGLGGYDQADANDDGACCNNHSDGDRLAVE
jgi:hypothetical protein